MGVAILIDCNYDKTKIKDKEKFILKPVYKITENFHRQK